MSHQYPNQPQQPGHQMPAGPPPPKKKKAGKIAGFGCLGVVALLVIIGIAASGGDNNKASGPTPADKPAATSNKASNDDKPAGSAKGEKPAKKTAEEYPDGDYVVGEDIPAGMYTSEGAKKGLVEFCGITTKPADPATVPQAKAANADERIIITLTKSDGVVSVSGCEPLRPRK